MKSFSLLIIGVSSALIVGAPLTLGQPSPAKAKSRWQRQPISAANKKPARRVRMKSKEPRLGDTTIINSEANPFAPASERQDVQPAGPRLQVQLGHVGRITHLAWGRDGKILASAASDNLVKLWEVESGRLINTLNTRSQYVSSIEALSLNPNGKLLAVARGDTAELWDTEQGHVVKTLKLEGSGGASIAWSPDGMKLAFGRLGGRMTVWLVKEGRALATFPAGRDLTWSPDGKRLALTGVYGYNIVMWDEVSGKVRPVIKTDYVASMAWSPDGKTLAWAVVLDPTVWLWEPEGGQEIKPLKGHVKGVSSLSWSPDSELLASAGGGGDGESARESIRVWERKTSGPYLTYKEAPSASSVVAWGPDGQLLASGDDDGVVRLWDAKTGQIRTKLTGQSVVPLDVRWSPDGQMLIVENVGNYVDEPHRGNAVRLWDLQKGKLRSSFTGAYDWSPDGSLFASSGPDDNTVKLWDVRRNEVRATLGGHSGPACCLTFSPDGHTLASWSRDHHIRLWDAESWQLRSTADGKFNSTDAVTWSPDGRTFVSHDASGVLELRDTRTGQKRARLAVDYNAVVAWNADGSLLAVGDSNGTVRLWNARTARARPPFAGGGGELSSLDWSPDGGTLISAAGGKNDGNISFWDVKTNRLRKTVEGLLSPGGVWWSPSGKFLVIGDSFGGIEVRDVKTGSRVKVIRPTVFNIGVSSLTPDRRLMAVPDRDNTLKLWDVESQRLLATLQGDSEIQSVAFSPDGKMLATINLSGTCTLWAISDSASDVHPAVESTARASSSMIARQVCTLVTLGDDMAVVTPEGRFDTNNLELARNLYWVVADEPFQTLPIEIFMRHYYSPGLLASLLKGRKLPGLIPVAELNRAQPKIEKIVVLPQASNSELVDVKVEVSSVEGRCLKGNNHVPCESGVYDLRLYRDGQLVKQFPSPTVDASANNSDSQNRQGELQKWRQSSVVKAKNGQPITVAAGPQEVIFTDIHLPRRVGVSQVEFTAYAFNEDRVKSATSDSVAYTVPAARSVVKRRAYVITVGVDATSDPTLRLGFAPNGAREIEKLLRTKLEGQYEFVPVQLISEYKKKSNELQQDLATKGNIRTMLKLLSTQGETAEQQPVFPTLKPATPDDLVVFYIASHGYVDPSGKFYVIPSDIGEPEGVSAQLLDRCLKGPERPRNCQSAYDFLHHSISSDELTQWLQGIDAGQMVLILDSCYSAAVTGPNFKPGPMGDSSFGQLSYDKGMLVLAATQAENVAWGALELGDRSLLTEALINQLGQGREQPFDLRRWVKVAEKQVSDLYRRYVKQEIQQEQQPELFDFARWRSAVANNN